ncbi:MAG: hypothetical protein EOR57_31615 [Mesorhizobium sp.]|uniref:hypothetical protein n=1 Tax=Mesorhizobium sp. TaxID=1871066 RepID=UPI000FE79B83|nr:hypothetical protein [Mesorhizobium sp.]RWL14896.1 MAG: hypothetical protein EOR57_31615 [Mesorhizobium sp.]
MTSIAIDLADGLSSATAYKGPCKVATTANITLSGEQTIDGEAIVTGDRVLVRAQTSSVNNGIYVADTGPWRRAKDFAGNRDVRKGTRVWVTDGDSGPIEFEVTTENPVLVGTDDIVFTNALGTIVQANVPIYASKAAAAAASIVAGVKKIELQFYNPSYAVLNTLVGRGEWSRMSKVDIDALAYPALAQFRSLDRIMPDGSTDATNGGYWVLNDPEPTPQMLGLFNEAVVSTDQTATLQAWFTLCGILGVSAIMRKEARIRTMDTVTIPSNINVDISKLLISYNGTRDRSVLSLTTCSNKVLRFGQVQGVTVDWTNEAYCGIYLQNVNDCFIWATSTRLFTVGITFAAAAGQSVAYNNIWVGRVSENKYQVRLTSLGALGFCNENRFWGGNYEQASNTTLLGVGYGVHITSVVGGYTGHNNNRWYAPCFELGGSVSTRIPFFFDGAGGVNTVTDARAENNNGPFALLSGDAAHNNEFGLSFGSTGAAGQVNTVQEVNGAYGNRITGGRYGKEARKSFTNLHRLLSSNGGANSPYISGDLFLVGSAGTALRTTTTAGLVRSNALALDVSSSVAAMVAVDTSKIKQWRIDVGRIGNLTDNLAVIAFDSAGNRLTGDATDVTYGDEPYVKGSGIVANAAFGGSYLRPGGTGGDLISVRTEVDTMWVGYYGTAIRSIELTGYTTSEKLDAASGLSAIATFVPLNDAGSVPLATANPGTAGTHGYYSVGQIVYNSAAASGVASGWQCTTAGWLAAAWTISTAYSVLGRIVTNDSGKMYQLVTAGTSAGAGGPTGTGSAITDGTCVWNYVGVKAVFQAIDLPATAIAAAVGVTVQAYDAQLSSLIRQNNQSAAYTLVLTDGGKMISHPAADTTARIWTIPANSSVAFPIGTSVVFDNEFGAGAITIAITTDTMELVGAAGSTGSRTLATGGRATAIKVGTTKWRISGQELT